MDNPARTARYLASMAERRRELQELLVRLHPGQSAVVLEVGCGHGHFLTAYAAAHPETRCFGIDIVSERIARAVRKRDRASLANLHFIQAEARLFIEMLPPDIRLSDVFVLFPDPWPKLRHHKHRIMQPEFLDAVAGRAAPGCRLCFRTDFAPYFDETLALVRTHARWKPVEDPWPFEFETVFQSRAPVFQSLIARPRASAIS